MAKKPTYEELEQRIKELKKEVLGRKRAEKELRESEERYRSLVESTEDSIYLVDRECKYQTRSVPMKEKILIIDRKSDIRKTLETLLRKEEYQVRSASGGQKAIDILKSEPSELVIMDINMPGSNGLQAMRKIKKLDGEIEVIIFTGSASIDNAVQALRHDGAFDFLTKPLENLDQLIISVKQALEKRRLHKKRHTFQEDKTGQ